MEKQINIIQADNTSYQNAIAYVPGDDRIGGVEKFHAACAELEAQGLVCVDPRDMQTIMSLPKDKVIEARVSCLWCGGRDMIAYRLPGQSAPQQHHTETTSSPVQGNAGEDQCETAVIIKIDNILAGIELAEENKHHPGWCNKCRSYCYGDCEF